MSAATVRIEDGGIFDVMVVHDVEGALLSQPRVFAQVFVRQRGELLVAVDVNGDEVTPSLVVSQMERVPRREGKILGFRARGQNADTFARQSWVLFPSRAASVGLPGMQL